MAAGIMRILHQRGVQLPQQLSIVGFDDVVLARYLYPALTTMHYPVEQMARCAAQLAIQLYRGITPPPSSNHFNAELVIRDSVAPYFHGECVVNSKNCDGYQINPSHVIGYMDESNGSQ